MKKYILIAFMFIFLAFKADKSKSTYSIPLAAFSVTAGDIDMDGDNDIIVGHNYCSLTQWSGVSIMLNDGNGNFSLFDSIFLFGWQTNILMENINSEPNNEIIAKYENAQEENEYVAIINDFDLSDISYFSLNTYEGVSDKVIGDIDGDGNKDIVLSSHGGQFWGILYNNGQGNFTQPDYHYVSNYHPKALACDDLNNDGRDDIIVCGQSTEVYFSNTNGFDLLTLEGSDDASIIDFDLDGDNDIITYVSFWNITTLNIYENIGGNEFELLEEFSFQSTSSKYFISDFNNDNLPDVLFQLHDNSGFFIYYNQGNFQLTNAQFVPLPLISPEEEGSWRDSYCADMDGNGYNDIIIVKTLFVPFPNNLEILFNDGNGNFVDDPITGIQTSNFNNQYSKLTCYPNPFQYEIVFEFAIDKPSQVELSIYNVQGKLIKSIKQKTWEGGENAIKWNGLDKYGKDCKAGHYLFNMIINGEEQQSIKFIKLN